MCYKHRHALVMAAPSCTRCQPSATDSTNFHSFFLKAIKKETLSTYRKMVLNCQAKLP